MPLIEPGSGKPDRLQEILTHSPDETRCVGKWYGGSLHAGDCVALSGIMGAGKTVFVQGLAESLAVNQPVTSPTFTLINEYSGALPLYHMDLYRLSSSAEFVWLGTDDPSTRDGIYVIEWADKAADDLPARTRYVLIEVLADGKRKITLNAVGAVTQ